MARQSQLTSLERRLLLAGNVTLEAGTLTIKGTKEADFIEIGRDPKYRKLFSVSMNGRTFRFNLGAAKSVWFDSGRGNDRVVDHGGWRAPAWMTFNGGTGDDFIEMHSWGIRLEIQGGSGNDKLVGVGDGKFALNGGDGNDTLYGGIADDSLVGGAGSDFIDGGKGRDEWSNGLSTQSGEGIPFTSPIRLTFDRKSNDGPVGENDNVRSVEVLIGSHEADTIDASGADAAIWMPPEDNRGADFIIGSRFDDSIALWNFSASHPGITVHGGDGDDTISGDLGADWIYGDAGNDVLNGRGYIFAQPDHIEGGAGNDSITSGIGSDYLDGGIGNDTIATIGGQDTIIGYAGNDLIRWDSNINSKDAAKIRGIDVRGGSGRDTLTGKSYLDLTQGGPSGFEVIT